jgi:hypothetical protein
LVGVGVSVAVGVVVSVAVALVVAVEVGVAVVVEVPVEATCRETGPTARSSSGVGVALEEPTTPATLRTSVSSVAATAPRLGVAVAAGRVGVRVGACVGVFVARVVREAATVGVRAGVAVRTSSFAAATALAIAA